MKKVTTAQLVACLLLLLAFQVDAEAQPRRAQLAEINSYVANVDRFMKRNPRARRIFAEVSTENDNEPKWREFKTKREFDKFEGNPDESAFVWTRADKLIAAAFTFTSQSGDWVHMITYYFRDDGSLAKIEAQLNTFYGDVSIVRNQYFNNAGVRISNSERILDLKTQKPMKKPADYFDQPVTVFKKVTDLPFYKLLFAKSRWTRLQNYMIRDLTSASNTTDFKRLCVKPETPPALAAWRFNFDLQQTPAKTKDTTYFSSVEFQFQPSLSTR